MPDRRRTRVPLNSFASFEVVSRHLNMRVAGDELGVTAAAISHQVAKLEDFVGCPLLLRDGRRLALTREGRHLAGELGRAFALIDDGIDALSQRTAASTPITISSTYSICSFWLPPLARLYGGISPSDYCLATCQSQVELAQSDADLVIAEFVPEDGRACVPLFDAEILPVCAPSLLAEHPGETLATLPLVWIDYSLTQKRTAPLTWDLYFREFGIERSFDKRGVSVHPSHATHAALAGLGVQLGRRPIVERLLEQGDLVQVGPPCSIHHRFYLWSRPVAHLRPAVSAFRTWLLEHVGAPDAPLSLGPGVPGGVDAD